MSKSTLVVVEAASILYVQAFSFTLGASGVFHRKWLHVWIVQKLRLLSKVGWLPILEFSCHNPNYETVAYPFLVHLLHLKSGAPPCPSSNGACET